MQNYLEKAKQWLKSDNCWQKIKGLHAHKNEDASVEADFDQQKEDEKESVFNRGKKDLEKVKENVKEILGYAFYYAGPYRKQIIAGCSGSVLLMAFCFYQTFSMG